MKTILNKKNIDTTKQPLFLGEDLALQRYEKPKYETFLKLFRKMLNFFWMPEEVNLNLDSSQFKTLQPYEKHIFTKNLQFQTLMDSVIARGVPSLTEHVSNPELEACMNVWQFFENIHSYAYTYLIKNVYSDPTEIMDGVLEDKEILARCDSVSREYDRLRECSEGDLKKQIYLTLISINILEAIRFYVSFIMGFAFANNKKMIGNADILRLIKRDEACMTEDTEVLTPDGWIRFDKLKDGVKVAQYNPDGTTEFVIPAKVIRKEYSGDLINIKNTIGHVDMLVTPDHRVISERVLDGSLIECNAEDFCGNYTKKIPVAAEIKGNIDNLSYHERFLIALQADGSIPNPGLRNGKINGCHTTHFSFKRKRKNKRFRWLLDKLGYKYTESKPNERGQIYYYVLVPLDQLVSKNFSDWVNLGKVSSNWCKQFVEELMYWDGSIRKDTGSLYYSSKVEKNIEIAQTIACLAGYKTYKYFEEDNRKESYSTIHRLSILPDKRTQSGQSLSKAIIKDFNGIVYCVSVPSGMFLARRNNGIFITGNCHLQITQEIIKILRENPEEGFQQIVEDNRDEAIRMFKFAVEEEKAWAQYLFKDGGLLGLNYEIVAQYIEWLADTRLEQLDLPKQYEIKKSPIGGWITPWMDSESVQLAPQELEQTVYKTFASKSDISTEDFSDLEL